MIDQAGAERFDAFGEAAELPRPAEAGPSLPALVALFWIAAAILVGGRLYVEIGHGASGPHAALHSASVAQEVR